MKKTRSRKSRDTVPLRVLRLLSQNGVIVTTSTDAFRGWGGGGSFHMLFLH
jgi:hypothetical protein